ncbi:MAG: flagellar biosynthesis protein FlhA [Acidobacteriota bacterium]|nr:flagellar biosynthesis protein FlhA [Acidobacteriota bacterium]
MSENWINFKDYALHKQVVRIWEAGQTGTLNCRLKGYIKTLYFQSGTVTFATSDDPQDSLVQVLIDQGRFNEGRFGSILPNFNNELSIGRNLVETGLISQQELVEGTEKQVFRIFKHTINIQEGRFNFKKEDLPKDMIALPLSFPEKIFEAVLPMEDRAWISNYFPIDFTPEKNEEKPIDFAKVKIGRFAEPTFKLIDGERQYQQLLLEVDISCFLLLKFLYALSFSGYISIHYPEVQGDIFDGDSGGVTGRESVGSQVRPLLNLDRLGLEIGYGLIPLVDTENDGNILERLHSLRRQLAVELGIVVPPIRIRDNLELKPNHYALLLKGVTVGSGQLMLKHLLAINPGAAVGELDGVFTKEPAFGLDGYWISESQEEHAQSLGYTVVNLQTVIITHLSEIIKRHYHKLLGRQETHFLIENLARTHPKIVEDLIPNILPLGTVQKVLQNLLAERVSIRDLLSILESLAEHGVEEKDSWMLSELVRRDIARTITNPYLNEDGDLHVMTLNSDLEGTLSNAIRQSGSEFLVILDSKMSQLLVDQLHSVIASSSFGIQLVLLVSPALRRPLRKLVEKVLPDLVILSQAEIANDINVVMIGEINM